MKTIPVIPVRTPVTISEIQIDSKLQMRAALSEEDIEAYKDQYKAGALLPPVTLFSIDGSLWVVDGFHRLEAFRRSHDGVAVIEAEVIPGSRRDAILWAVGANTHHGLRRTNEDKRRAVTTLLRDEEWGAWSHRRIADTCGVSAPFVESVREALGLPYTDRRVGTDGKGRSKAGTPSKKALPTPAEKGATVIGLQSTESEGDGSPEAGSPSSAAESVPSPVVGSEGSDD